MGIFKKEEVKKSGDCCGTATKLAEMKSNYDIREADYKAEATRKQKAADADFALQLAQRDFDLKNTSDKRVLDAEARATKAENDMLVLAKELEVTQKIVDINSDIVDVKDIINKLITALPKIDLNSITVNAK